MVGLSPLLSLLLSAREGIDRAVNGAGDEEGEEVVGVFCFRSACIRTVPSNTTKANSLVWIRCVSDKVCKV